MHLNKKMCEACGRRPATRCKVIGDTGQTKTLCDVCASESASTAQVAGSRQAERILEYTKCSYCGAPAVECSVCYDVDGAAKEETDAWCEKCRDDLARFEGKPENAIPDFDVDNDADLDKVSRFIEARKLRKKEFMRQRIRERGNL